MKAIAEGNLQMASSLSARSVQHQESLQLPGFRLVEYCRAQRSKETTGKAQPQVTHPVSLSHKALGTSASAHWILVHLLGELAV